jgi:tRNA/rRNA methyltransferase
LLAESQRDRIDVVLVSPRNPLNIGAVARAMANFGFAQLAVAAPYAPHWREAKSAIGAPDVLQNARSTECLGDAIAHSTLVIGTGTLTYRKPEQPVVPLPALAPYIADELARGGRISLVFGPEKHGLTRENLSLCHLLVEIPTDARQPSMNLGQAVAVCLYELVAHASALPGSASSDLAVPARSSPAAAPSGSVDLLADLIDQTMTAAGYSPTAMQQANRHDLQLLLRRFRLNRADTHRALGFFRRVLWRLTHPAK